MSHCIMYMLRQDAYGAVVICAAAVEQKGNNFYLAKSPTSKLQDYKAATAFFMNRERFMASAEYKMLWSASPCMYGRDLRQLFRAWNNTLRVAKLGESLLNSWEKAMGYIADTYDIAVPHRNDDNLRVCENDGHVFGIVRCELKDFIDNNRRDIEDLLSSKLTGDVPLYNVEYEVVSVEPDNVFCVYVSGNKTPTVSDTVYDDIHFDKTVYACNDIKKIFATCSLIINDPSEHPLSLVGDAERTVDALSRYLAMNIVRARTIPELEESFCGAVKAIVPDSIHNALNKLKEDAELSDAWYLPLGDFWNEVAMPNSLYDAFERYIKKLAEVVPGMLGVEASREDAHCYDENTTALSIYDLSDFAIVFKNEEFANEFIGHYEIDPVDMMFWNGTGWCGA